MATKSPNRVYSELTQRLRIEHAKNKARLEQIKSKLDSYLNHGGLMPMELLDEQDRLVWRNHDITKILEA